MFKITSHFYVIYGDDEPIYVGYTNRTVKQRFTEHKHEKDFYQYDKVLVKELKEEKLSFPFTWDYIKTCENADTVSKREAELVNLYHTQDSEYQRAIGGGQTWASEKSFVKSNRNNPKFVNMSTSQVKEYLDARKREQMWISTFIEPKKSNEQVWLTSFVGRIKPVEQEWLSNFINSMETVEKKWLGNFINDIKPAEQLWIRDFVNHMKKG